MEVVTVVVTVVATRESAIAALVVVKEMEAEGSVVVEMEVVTVVVTVVATRESAIAALVVADSEAEALAAEGSAAVDSVDVDL